MEQLLRQDAGGAGHLDHHPWTLAANLAVVANPELDYVGIPVPQPATARRRST